MQCMMNPEGCFRRGAMAAAVLLGMTGAAHAGSIDIQSDTANSSHGMGSFVGQISYNYDSDLEIGKLIVELTNTSDQGFLTGFMFNINSIDQNASAALTETSHASFDDLAQSELDTSEFGTFEAGAGLHGMFENSIKPSLGVLIDDTGTFEFDVAAEDAMFLDALDFVTGEEDFNFLVRFMGFDGGVSDMVPGMSMIPTPHAALLGIAGLGVLVIAPRRRR